MVGARPVHIDIRLTDVEHGEIELRRQEIDVPVMNGTAPVGKQNGRRPDNVKWPDNVTRILKQIKLERYEALVYRVDDAGIGMRHGIQLCTASSRDFDDVDQ